MPKYIVVIEASHSEEAKNEDAVKVLRLAAEDLIEVVNKAHKIAENYWDKSEGYYDHTVGTVVDTADIIYADRYPTGTDEDKKHWWLISALSRWAVTIHGAEIKLTTDHQAFILYGTDEEVTNEATKIMTRGYKQNPPSHVSIKLMAVMDNIQLHGNAPFDGPKYSIYILGKEDNKTY